MEEQQRFDIRSFITCPHCWNEFPVDQILWISESPENLGDIRLGESAPQRFLPTRFNARGAAIDVGGFACGRLACPKCHLTIPRSFVEIPPYFVSIAGAPASGKSYFLASMTWKLRKTLPGEFGIAFSDADPEMNLRLHQYESTQFMDFESEQLVALEKTEVYGSMYSTVFFNDQRISYPQPFVFSLVPMPHHPNAKQANRFSYVLSLYDNAGESYLPGADAGTHPVTRHLAQSQCIFFLYDPTQDQRFRALCRNKSKDPQLQDSPRSALRQDTILAEMVKRVRLHKGMSTSERHDKPLYIIVTKLDSWSHLLENKDWSDPWKRVRSRDPDKLIVKNATKNAAPTDVSSNKRNSGETEEFGDSLEDIFGTSGFDTNEKSNTPESSASETQEAAAQQQFRSLLSGFSTKRVDEVSREVRELLKKHSPEIVMTAEQFSREVRYIPMSATGRAPSMDPESGRLGFRPKEISPIWAEAPILYALAKSTRGIIPVLQPKKKT